MGCEDAEAVDVAGFDFVEHGWVCWGCFYVG